MAERKVYLHPGQVFVSPDPAEVTTVLGSCVAVCVFDRVGRRGGANHFLLPLCAGDGQSSARFGNVAVRKLIERMLALGSLKQDLEAKVFGGACTVEALHRSDGHLGTKNAEVALRTLRQEGVPVVADDVGGRRGRRLVFRTDTGVALVRLI
ncbi:MAG TPA: chemotaxis protein CheD [Vicinamibacteria bacterium]|nr:chemotaxis protein CheD [Vicinamibacteria bacterium]